MTKGGSGREGGRALKVRVKTARKRSPASARWLERQLNDPYVAQARREGFRSRAAYKLIEIDDRLKLFKPGQRIVDLGAAPGGWSWVLQRLGARVIAVDKAPLEPRIAALPGIEQRAMSAFALEPRDVGPVDWLCSDVVCYPKRLLALIEKFLAAGTVKNFLCTIKFQGATDFATQARFAAIPGARLLHLHHNKHELTWARLSPS